MARPLSLATTLPIYSISSKSGAEGVTSPSVSDEDGFSKPQSALDESDSSVSEEEESELLELDVSGPLLLISTSNGAESSVSVSDESESSVSELEESESLDSDESESLLLSAGPGENSEPPTGAPTGTVPLVGQPAVSGNSLQSSHMRLGPPSQAQLARWMTLWACFSHGRLSVGGPSC